MDEQEHHPAGRKDAPDTAAPRGAILVPLQPASRHRVHSAVSKQLVEPVDSRTSSYLQAKIEGGEVVVHLRSSACGCPARLRLTGREAVRELADLFRTLGILMDEQEYAAKELRRSERVL